MILRLWRGWTAPDKSLAYEKLLLSEIGPAILDRGIPGLRDLTVLRRDPRELDSVSGGEILTAMTFQDLDAVAAFTGGSPSTSVVPPSARKVLARFDRHSQHYISLARFPSQLTD